MMSNDWHGVCNQTEFRVLAGYENLFAHTVAVMRLHLSKKDNPLLTYMYISRLVAILFFQLLFPKTLFFLQGTLSGNIRKIEWNRYRYV